MTESERGGDRVAAMMALPVAGVGATLISMSLPGSKKRGIEPLLVEKRESQERVRDAFARGEELGRARRPIAWERREIRIVRAPEW